VITFGDGVQWLHGDGEGELDTQKIADFFFLLYYMAWDEGVMRIEQRGLLIVDSPGAPYERASSR
jgi:hypothetical protein